MEERKGPMTCVTCDSRHGGVKGALGVRMGLFSGNPQFRGAEGAERERKGPKGTFSGEGCPTASIKGHEGRKVWKGRKACPFR